ncbi:MAG: hypothetical protein MUD10_00705 [Candidatus Pacebacteria bacterium]|jgi:hypothetical protein|nr:hypothetical protein [Candidatus Paceibacterota bacterium]
MNQNKNIAALLLSVSLAAGAGLPTLAENASSTTNSGLGPRERLINERGAKGSDLESIKDRGNREIENRLQELARISERVDSMKRVSADTKKSINSEIDTNIKGLKELMDRIATSTDAGTALKNEQLITKDFRIYNLVVPRGYIIASADRIQSLSEKISGLSEKLAAKVAELNAAGKNTAALESQLANIKTKVDAAIAAADAIQKSVSGLAPDQGNRTTAAANREAMVKAREDARRATGSLKEARAIANNIAQQIRAGGGKTSSGFGPASSTTEK